MYNEALIYKNKCARLEALINELMNDIAQFDRVKDIITADGISDNFKVLLLKKTIEKQGG